MKTKRITPTVTNGGSLQSRKFNLADETTASERQTFGENPRAIMSEDSKRRPLKGEWYLSGAIVEAYRAPSDLATQYYIARLIRTL